MGLDPARFATLRDWQEVNALLVDAETERDRLRLELENERLQTNVEIGEAERIEVERDQMQAALTSALKERDRLRAVVDAVRVMWDNVVGTENDAVMGFPVADYDAIERALDALDVSGETTDG